MAQSPNLLQGPDPMETTELHFKLYSKLKVFEPTVKFSNGKHSLLAISQYYGLIFIGNVDGFSVIPTKSIKEVTNGFPKKDISLGAQPTHITVDFSQKNVAVVCSSPSGAVLYIYSIASFTSKNISPVKLLNLSKLGQNLSTQVSELLWQPNADSILMICMLGGSVLAINPNAKDNSVHILPSSTQAMCCCWSPKGKQIVIGCGNGCLSQFKPDLKLVKTLPPPSLSGGAVTVISVLWISNYQFAVAYSEKDNTSSFPVFTIVNAAKNEPMNVINYDDITYSTTNLRQNQVYLFHQNEWNLIFVSSAKSMEVAVLHSKDNATWEQWLPGDASRAELPLTSSRQETFPLGMAFDLTSSESIPWGESNLSPMPRLLLLSDEGVLCIFNIVNLMANATQLCGPPKEQLPEDVFVRAVRVTHVTDVVSTATTVAPLSVQSFSSQPMFGMPKPNFTTNFNTSSGGFSFQAQSTPPQVTVSTSGGNIISGIKDIPFLQSQQTNANVPQSSQQQQSPAINTLSTSPNFSQKLTTVVPRFGMSNSPTFIFGTPLANSTIVTKPFAQPIVSSVEASSFTQSPILGTVATNVVKEQPSIQQGSIFSNKTILSHSNSIKPSEDSQKLTTKSLSNEDKTTAEESTGNSNPLESSKLPELPAVDDSVYLGAIRDEIDHFNSELKHLSQKMKTLVLQVGTAEDKDKLRKTMEELHEFWKELKETTITQSTEIHSIVTDLMESFAWLEDAKSRNLQRKNPSFIELKKTEELDPISARHMNEIGHLKYYIENQLKQLTTHLEKEWMDHQDSYRTEVKNRMAVPSLEEVYKAMHFQLKILNKQRALVEELKGKLTAKKRQNKSLNTLINNSVPIIAPSQGSSRVSELSKLADNLLQLKINRDENISAIENRKALASQLNSIRYRSKKLTVEKQSALRDVLSERDMVKIRPVKTTIENSSFLRSLALEKSARKAAAKEKEALNQEKEKQKLTLSPVKPKNTVFSKTQSTPPPKPETEKIEIPEKPEPKKLEQPSRNMFVFGNATLGDKPLITVKAPPATEKSPLASLTSVVSNLGKESDSKSTSVIKPVETLRSSSITTNTTTKESFVFGAVDNKSQKNSEENKPTSMFTFGSFKSGETLFGKTGPPKFDGKLIFGPSTPQIVSKQEVSTTSTTTTSTAASTTVSLSSFTFSSTSVASADSSGLPKINLSFGTKDQSTTSCSSTGNLFSISSTSTPAFTFGSGSIFGGIKATTTPTSSIFAASTPSTGFTFSQPVADSKVVVTEVSVIRRNPESENKEVDVETVDEVKKTEESQVISKPTSNFVFGVKSKVTTETTSVAVTSSVAASSIQTVPSGQSTTITTTNIFGKTELTTSGNISTPTLSIFGQQTTTATTSSAFSFNLNGSNSFTFGLGTSATTPTTVSVVTVSAAAKTLTTTTTTTAAAIFSAATTTTVTAPSGTTTTLTPSVSTTSTPIVSPQSPTPQTTTSEKPSPTVKTMNIFGGGTVTTNIFGVSAAGSKPVFSQAVPSTTGSIFGGGSSTLTPTTSTLGQPSSPGSTSAFNDSVSQTTNIFGQLLSESNQSGNLFATSSTAATATPNLFTPKNIFSSVTTTSSGPLFQSASTSLFGSGSSVFGGQSTSQPTSSAGIFGQTPASSSFFGQNICSPFSASTAVTSNQGTLDSAGFGSKPIFGQLPFGQMTGNTSLFDTSGSSIFGGTSNSTSSSSSVFQTTTTSFGGSSPGPFSSNQGSVAKTGFKADNTFQKPLGGFGSPPVFASGPSTSGFGMVPTFSSGSSFGSQPAFGSVPGVFNTSQAGSFSQPQGHSTTFENLANQNTVGFGNLAQQSQNQGFGAFSASPTFENKSAFEGSSFSSWRSN